MVSPSYLVRRAGGSFQVQVRLPAALANAFRRTHFKTALGTHDPGIARERSRRVMNRIEPYVRAPDLASMGNKIWNDMRLELRLGPTLDGSRYRDRQLIEQIAREFQEKVRSEDLGDSFDLFAFGKTFLEFCRMQEAEGGALASTKQPLAAGIDFTQPEASASLSRTAAPLAEMTNDLTAFSAALKQVLATLSEHPASGRDSVPTAQPPSTLAFSDAAEQFLKFESRQGKTKSREDKAKAILEFVDAYLGQPKLADMTDDVLENVDTALSDIPNIHGFSTADRQGLFHRYQVAQTYNEKCAREGRRKDGWSDGTFTRMSTSSVEARFHIPLNAFFKWTREKGLLPSTYRFHKLGSRLLVRLPRDALSDKAALSIVRLPIFTGCAGIGDKKRWKTGPYLIQGHVYWTLLLLMFTGMRTGEAVRLKIDRIREGDGFHFVDLRPFDAAKGRISLADLEEGKTKSAARLIPIHPLLIKLGLLEWRDRMLARKSERLFPQWKPPTNKNGGTRWADPVSKLWRTVRKHAGVKEKNVSAYSLRHLFADWLDRSKPDQRTRNRVVGHVDRKNEADTYGSKAFMPPEVAAQITKLNNRVIREITKVLMGAVRQAKAEKLKRIVPDIAKKKSLKGNTSKSNRNRKRVGSTTS